MSSNICSGVTQAGIKLSIVVRTCGRPRFLSRALASIGAQTRAPDAVIVVDDGREAVSVVSDSAFFWGWPVRVVKTQGDESSGRAAAWNVGLREVEAGWVATLDDDDTWEPTFLAEVVEAIEGRGGSGGLYGVAVLSDQILERWSGTDYELIERKDFNSQLRSVRMRDMVLANRFTNNAFVFPVEALETIGYVREDLEVLEDWEFNVRFASHFPIHLLTRVLSHYHIRLTTENSPNDNSSQVHREKQVELLREEWIRSDLCSGRFGLGFLSLIAEVQRNPLLRIGSRFGKWSGRES